MEHVECSTICCSTNGPEKIEQYIYICMYIYHTYWLYNFDGDSLYYLLGNTTNIISQDMQTVPPITTTGTGITGTAISVGTARQEKRRFQLGVVERPRNIMKHFRKAQPVKKQFLTGDKKSENIGIQPAEQWAGETVTTCVWHIMTWKNWSKRHPR